MADRFDTQVRLPGRTVHRLVGNTFEPGRGRLYTTRCGTVLTNVQGAMLTTHDVGCGSCLNNSLAVLRDLAELATAEADA